MSQNLLASVHIILQLTIHYLIQTQLEWVLHHTMKHSFSPYHDAAVGSHVIFLLSALHWQYHNRNQYKIASGKKGLI